MTAKTDMRREIREQRGRLEHPWVIRASARIQQRVLQLAEWAAAQLVCAYLATPEEVQTALLLDACRQSGKRVWVPAFQPERRQYACARLDWNAAPAPGPHGVLEPAAPAWEEPAAFDLVLVPGLAFDSRGGRIGHGGGHYDRLLARAALRAAVKIGLAFAFQLRSQVPTATHDAGLDLVVTEKEVIRCHRA